METALLIYTIILAIAAIFQIASVAVGIECYNLDSTKSFKEEKMSNYNFLLSQIMAGILFLVISGIGMYIAFS
jgi:TM2 domain-containing membrane protein YozV